MKDSITLSPAHGVNPSVTICFWCGADTGVALLGRIDKQDSEAPRTIVLGLEPCDTCKEQWNQGYTIIETTTAPPHERSIPIGRDDRGNDVYPTGRWVVITLEAAARILGDNTLDGVHRALTDTVGFESFLPKEDDAGDPDDSPDQTDE